LLQQNLISFLQTGQKVLHYTNKTTTVTNQQIAILSSGNCLMTEKLSTENTYCSTLFFFDNTALTNFSLEYTSLLEGISSKTRSLQEPFVVIEKDDFVKNFIASLEFVLQRPTVGAQAMLKVKFEEFMLYLLEKHPQALLSFQASKQVETASFEIRRIVEKHIATNITVKN
jgi:hypothetical protein